MDPRTAATCSSDVTGDRHIHSNPIHGFFLFFLLFPKVLLLPSVTLAKNCEHESRGVRHTWYLTPCMERGCGCVHPLGESSRASRRSRVA